MSTDFSSVAMEPAVRPAKAPLWPALAAVGTTVLALALIVPGTGSINYAATGYLLGALVVPAWTVAYRFGRRAALRNPFFIPSRPVERLVLCVLALGIAAGMANAWSVATELAKK